jgi:hypothetical protein
MLQDDFAKNHGFRETRTRGKSYAEIRLLCISAPGHRVTRKSR